VDDHDIVTANQWSLENQWNFRRCATHFPSMIAIIIICLLTGAIQGLRFKVFVLVPTMGLALVGAAIVAAAQGDQFWLTAAKLAIIAATIQIGYLAGLFCRAAAQTGGAFGRESFIGRIFYAAALSGRAKPER
jgi:hypothetical protein